MDKWILYTYNGNRVLLNSQHIISLGVQESEKRNFCVVADIADEEYGEVIVIKERQTREEANDTIMHIVEWLRTPYDSGYQSTIGYDGVKGIGTNVLEI